MKSKKLLSVLLSFGLIMTAAAPGVMAKPADSNGVYSNITYSDYQNSPANYEAIIEMLRKQGKITDDMTEDKINEVLNDFLRKKDPANSKDNNELLYNKKVKMIKKSLDYKISNEDEVKILKGIEKSSPNVDEVQKEDYNGGQTVVKPLVVLMDYPDYKHEDMATKEAASGDEFFKDYSTNLYQNMLFNEGSYKWVDEKTDLITMKQYYLEQSGGSMLIDGKVMGWYTAEHNAAYYGGNDQNEDDNDPKALIKEALKHVVDAHDNKEINLADFDKVNNSNPDDKTPDGLIDYFIVVHAGIGEEAGGGSLGADAIWAHKSSIRSDDGTDAYRVKGKDGTWGALVYNCNPQDGKVGVFSHEFGHALGLPDEYDTAYSLKKYGYRGDPVSRWSIMAGGSWTGKVGGTEPVGFSPECKKFFQANYGGNWLHGETVKFENIPEEGIDLLIDQASTKGTNNDVVRIDLPAKKDKLTELVDGQYGFFSYAGNKLDNSLQFDVDLTGKDTAELTFKTWYKIEEGWDFGSIAVREKGQENWTVIKGNITTTERDPKAMIIVDHGITGDSKGWIDGKFDLNQFANKNIEIKFQYQTDEAAEEPGWYVDKIKVASGEEVLKYFNAEEENDEIKLDGFIREDGHGRAIEQYYLVEVRNHQGVDKGLKNAASTQLTYDPGLVTWYVNKQYSNRDNILLNHLGEGYIGVVDAQQEIPVMKLGDKTIMSKNALFYMRDAAFSIKKGSDLNFVYNDGTVVSDPSLFMNPYFDDSRNYYESAAFGRKLENHGLKIYVTGQSKDGSVMRIHIAKDEPKSESDK